MQVTRQMLIWVMPWLIIRIVYGLIETIINGINKNRYRPDAVSLTFAAVVVNGACWTGVLFGFIKTAADPGPWDWSHIQSQQPQIAQQGGQNTTPQKHIYQPSAPPPVQV